MTKTFTNIKIENFEKFYEDFKQNPEVITFTILLLGSKDIIDYREAKMNDDSVLLYFENKPEESIIFEIVNFSKNGSEDLVILNYTTSIS